MAVGVKGGSGKEEAVFDCSGKYVILKRATTSARLGNQMIVTHDVHATIKYAPNII